MTLFVSKPTRVEAVQWTGENWSEVQAFGGPDAKVAAVVPESGNYDEITEIQLLAGLDGAQEWVPVPVGHWLVNQPGDKSDIWPVAAEFFAAKYQPDLLGPASVERVATTIESLGAALDVQSTSANLVIPRDTVAVAHQVLSWLVHELLLRLVPTVRPGETLLSARYVREDARTVP